MTQEQLTVIGSLAGIALGAILSAYTNHIQTTRQRRYELYAKAFQDVLTWREMFYRVLRRDQGKKESLALVQKFHDLQESIDYHTGWIGAESAFLSKSYRRLTQEVRKAMSPLMPLAWQKPFPDPWTSLRDNPELFTKEKEAREIIDKESARFLYDVRLSFWPFHTGKIIASVAHTITDWKDKK